MTTKPATRLDSTGRFEVDAWKGKDRRSFQFLTAKETDDICRKLVANGWRYDCHPQGEA